MKRSTGLVRLCVSLLLLLAWLLEPGLAFAQAVAPPTDREPLRRSPQTVVDGLSFPTFVELLDGSAAPPGVGSLLLGNTGRQGRYAGQILRIEPDNKQVQIYAAGLESPLALGLWQDGAAVVLAEARIALNAEGNVLSLASGRAALLRFAAGAPSAVRFASPDLDATALTLVEPGRFVLASQKVVSAHRFDRSGKLTATRRTFLVGATAHGPVLDLGFVSESSGSGKLYLLDGAGNLRIFRATLASESAGSASEEVSVTDELGRSFSLEPLTTVRTGLNAPIALKVQPGNGHLWVANRGDGSLVELDGDGRLVRRIDTDLGGAQLWDLAFAESAAGKVEELFLTATGGVGVTPDSAPAGKLMRLVLLPLEVRSPLPDTTSPLSAGEAIQIRLSAPVDPRSLTNRVVGLETAAGKTLAAGLKLSAPDVVEVQPQAPLGGQTVVVTLRPGLADLYGNTLVQLVRVRFQSSAQGAVGANSSALSTGTNGGQGTATTLDDEGANDPRVRSGATVVRGRVLAAEVRVRPLAGVVLRPFCQNEQQPARRCNPRLSTLKAVTDREGRFELVIPAGHPLLRRGMIVLQVDGRPITGKRRYPAAETMIHVHGPGGHLMRIARPIYLPAVVRDTTLERVAGGRLARSRALPNASLFLPDGVRLQDLDGRTIDTEQIDLTPVEVGRMPHDLPDGVDASVAIAFQPGGVNAFDASGRPAPLALTFPNRSHSAPGTRVKLWAMSADGWHHYGWGKVSADARRIEPEACRDGDVEGQTCAQLGQKLGAPYGLTRLDFCGIYESPPSGDADSCNDGCDRAEGGDPIDLATGVFFHYRTDAYVRGGRVPFTLTRSYRTQDRNLGPFGVGTSHNWDYFLKVLSTQALELKLPDSVRYLFSLSADGGVFINESSPSMQGARITGNASSGWSLRMKNGTVYAFRTDGRLSSITNRAGNTLTFSRFGNALTRISSVSGSLSFTVSTVSRNGQTTALISSITDQAGRVTRYRYNANYQLEEVIYPDGKATGYTYEPTTNNQGKRI
jgi:YD repeat-containing protein